MNIYRIDSTRSRDDQECGPTDQSDSKPESRESDRYYQTEVLSDICICILNHNSTISINTENPEAYLPLTLLQRQSYNFPCPERAYIPTKLSTSHTTPHQNHSTSGSALSYPAPVHIPRTPTALPIPPTCTASLDHSGIDNPGAVDSCVYVS